MKTTTFLRGFRGLCGLAIAMALSSNLVAGNVKATLSGGTLFVYGDRNDNSIGIASTNPGEIVVSGFVTGSGEPTTVNGASEPAVLTGWTNGIYVYLYEGNDSVSLMSGDVLGHVHVDLGPGNDDATLGNSAPVDMVEETVDGVLQSIPGDGLNVLAAAEPGLTESSLSVKQTLVVLGGAGEDVVQLGDMKVEGHVTLDLGAGNDYVLIGSPGLVPMEEGAPSDVTFGNNAVIVPGGGDDVVQATSLSVARDLTIDDPVGAALVLLDQVDVGNNFLLFTSPADDEVEMLNVTVGQLFKLIAKEGVDFITVDGLMADRVEFYLGNGADDFYAGSVFANRVWSYLEGGDDLFEIVDSQIGTHTIYGGAGNDWMRMTGCSGSTAYIYGEGGTDTLEESGNSIGTINVYTVENRP